MTIKTWPVLAELAAALELKDARALNPAAFDAIADRLEAALASGDNASLDVLTTHLETLVRRWSAAGTEAARKAARGDPDADVELVNLLVTGRLAFAQNMAARALDKRANDDFYEAFADRRYKDYICALLSGPKTGTELADAAGVTEETVSRRLPELEDAGIVHRRKNGKMTVNALSPAARQYASTRRMSPIGGAVALDPVVQAALEEKSDQIGGHLQSARLLGVQPARVTEPTGG